MKGSQSVLPGRYNIVLDNENPGKTKKLVKKMGLVDTKVCESLEKALKLCDGGLDKKINEVFVTGGRSLYEYAIDKK